MSAGRAAIRMTCGDLAGQRFRRDGGDRMPVGIGNVSFRVPSNGAPELRQHAYAFDHADGGALHIDG